MKFVILSATGYEEKLTARGETPGVHSYSTLWDAFEALLAVGLPRNATVAQWVTSDMRFFVWADKSAEMRDSNGSEAIAVIRTMNVNPPVRP